MMTAVWREAVLVVCFVGFHDFLHAHPAQGRPAENEEADWWGLGQEELGRALRTGLSVGTARNVILFLGDGMGPTTVTAARFYLAQRRNISVSEASLEWDNFPYVSLSKTYNTNQQTPDSAATATAFLCGEKAQAGTLGVNQHVTRGHCQTEANNHLKSILHHSHDAGKVTGLVTTARVTHATPAAAYASSADRDWEYDGAMPASARGRCTDIARQLVDNNHFIRVILGGGRRSFLPENMTDPERPEERGRRTDGRDLTQEWINRQVAKVSADKVNYVMNRTDFMAIDDQTTEYVMGLFEAGHMQYESDREDPAYESWGEPSLAEMTATAIKILSRNKEGYFLLVEGGRIDHAHHNGNAYRALSETVAMSDAVKMAAKLSDIRDTLMVTTADHSHVFTMSGYSSIHNDILGLVNLIVDGNRTVPDLALDDLPFATLGYGTGPGSMYHWPDDSDYNGGRRNLTVDAILGNLVSKDFLQDATIPLKDESHGGEDVAVYARGPMAHLFHGTHEQSYIAHVMMYASCVGPNQDHCNKPQLYPGCPATSDTSRPVAFCPRRWLAVFLMYTLLR